MSTATWTNWGRTSRSHPTRVVRPSTAAEVADELARAARDGLRVRPVGSGHSFTALATTDDVLLETTGLVGLLDVDLPRRRITVGAGTTIGQTAMIARHLGLAFENLGDIDRQTVGGAIGTGTHGTGLGFGAIASRVVGMTLVTAAGEVLAIDEHDPLLPATRVHLGALGVVTSVSLQCVPTFAMSADERAEPLDAVLEAFADRAAAVDHFEFYWFPYSALALTKSNTRIPIERAGMRRSAFRRFVDDEALGNGVFELACRVGRVSPRVIPSLNRLAARAVAERGYSGDSHGVFVSPRRVRFAESEYAIPLAVVPEAFGRFRRELERRRLPVSFPVEVRATGADDSAWLGTATGRATGYIAVHCYHRQVLPEYFALAESIFSEYEGRPHWGKLHRRTAAELAGLYPHFDAFSAVRDRLDPTGVFRNRHLDRILGIPLQKS